MLQPAMLILVAMMIVLLAGVLWMVECLRHTKTYQRIPQAGGQMIIGAVFGALAIIAAWFGVEVGGAFIGLCNVVPICAGLFFGAPVGIVTGFIGGSYQFFWVVGTYTRIADALTTIVAGLCAAGIRKWMFDDKRPKWYYGFAIGIAMEILHMLMIILTHMQDIHAAFMIVNLYTLPTTLTNGVAVMIPAWFFSRKAKDSQEPKRNLQKITHSFSIWLLAVVLVAFAVTTAFSWVAETQLSVTDAVALLKLNIRDVRQDIIDASDENLLQLTKKVAGELDAVDEISVSMLESQLEAHDVAEINVIDSSGRIILTTHEAFQGYQMANGEQSAAFLPLLDGQTRYLVQSYQPTSYDKALSRKYAGVALSRGGFVQVAYDAQRFQRDIGTQVIGVTKNRHIGDSGAIIIADEMGMIVSDRRGSSGKTLGEIGLDLSNFQEGERFKCLVYGEESFCVYATSEGYSIIAVIPRKEVLLSRDVSLYLTIFMEAVIFAVLYVLIYHLIKTRIVDNIRRINESLAEITGGDLNVVVDVRSNEEFASLSDDINATVLTLKRYIAEAAARIDQELEFARVIQHSALPSAFPQRDEIDLHARMFTAKEVGGDFYDFYFVDSTHLAFLVADVSGKGIPAAMFMMTAKTLLKGYAESGRLVEDIFILTNEKLCENNEANMFVTAWMGVIDLQTGIVEYTNAGHNPPLIRRQDGSFEYLRSRPGLVLAGMDGIRYRKNTVQLAPGDTIFLYTDGVTEANDEACCLYGEKRLETLLNGLGHVSAEKLCEIVKRDLDAFAGNAEQFDDITMLCLNLLSYSHAKRMEEYE